MSEEKKNWQFWKREDGSNAFRKALVPRVAPDHFYPTLYDMGPMHNFRAITRQRIKQRGKHLRKAKVKQAWMQYPYGRFREELNVDTIRALAKSVWVQRCVTTLIEECLSQEWEIVPSDEEDEDDYSKLIKKITYFLNHPTVDEKETFKDFWHKVIKDVKEIDSAVIIKYFPEEDYITLDDNKQLGPQKIPAPITPVGRLLHMQVFDSYLFLKHIDVFGEHQGFWQFNYAQQSPKFFSDRELIWIEQNPSSYGFYGWSAVQQVEEMLETILAAVGNTKDYFEYGAIPAGVLSVDMSEPDYNKLHHYWETQIKGDPGAFPIVRHAGEGIDFIPFNEKTSDILFLEGMEFYQNIVASAFHMTPTELSMGDGGMDAGRIDSNVFKRKAVLPTLAKIQTIINRHIIPEFDEEKRVKFTWIYEPDFEEKAMQQQVSSERLNNAQITINEWRIEQGLDPLPWGDVPMAMISLGIFSRKMLDKKIEADMEMMDNPMEQMGGFPTPPGEQSNEPPKSKKTPAIQTEKPRGNKPENTYNQKASSDTFQKETETITRVAGNLEDCVKSHLKEIKDAHPEMEQKQQIAVAYSKCGASKKDLDGDFIKSLIEKAVQPKIGQTITLRGSRYKVMKLGKNPMGFVMVYLKKPKGDNWYVVQYDSENERYGHVLSAEFGRETTQDLTKQSEPLPTEVVDDFEIRAQDLDKQGTALEGQLIIKVKEFFGEVVTSMQQADEVVLRSADPTDIADYLAGLLDEKQLEKYVQDTLTSSYELGVNTIAEEEGQTEKGLISNLKYIMGYGKIVARQLLSTIRERIRFQIHENISKGQDMGEVLKKTVRQVTDYARDNTMLMAQTAVYNAINVGRINKLKSMGYETYTFYTMKDRRVCPECKPEHRKTFKIDDLSKKPPLHPNCRCFIKGTKDAGLPAWIIEEAAIHRGVRPDLEKITPKMAELELEFNKSINVILAEQLDMKKSIREIGRELGTSHVSILDFKEKCEL